MEATATSGKVELSKVISVISATLASLNIQNSEAINSSLVSALSALAPRTRNDNPYQYDNEGTLVAVWCSRYKQYLPRELFPDGEKPVTTSRVASWKIAQLNNTIKALKDELLARVVSGEVLSPEYMQNFQEKTKELELSKEDFSNFDHDLAQWEARDNKRL